MKVYVLDYRRIEGEFRIMSTYGVYASEEGAAADRKILDAADNTVDSIISEFELRD